MFIILSVTILSGTLFSKLLLFFNISDFRFRYPLAVLLSYFVFFACIRLWLACISAVRSAETNDVDWLDFPVPSVKGASEKAVQSIRAGGGQFLGAGASGSFQSPEEAPLMGATALADSRPSLEEGASKGLDHVAGKAVNALGDDNLIVAAFVLLVLIATILASGVFLIYGAPAILAEAAFQGALAASLAKRTRVISDYGWTGSIFKNTWKPFAMTLGIAILCGVVLHSYFPNAGRLADILWKS
jgi:hypothetical protein